MKKYLIKIKTNHTSEFITINGDSSRPFQIARNLWNYATPGHASNRLERIALSWENNGYTVDRIYGTTQDMPTRGDNFNVGIILREWK